MKDHGTPYSLGKAQALPGLADNKASVHCKAIAR